MTEETNMNFEPTITSVTDDENATLRASWKTTAAAAIRDPAPAPTIQERLAQRIADGELGETLQAAIENSKIANRDRDFAISLLRGFLKYGSFTDKQRPHVARLVAAPVPAAGPSPDAVLAQSLRAALDNGACAGSESFAASLLAGFARYGSFTDRQRPHVERLAARGDVPAPTPAPVAAPSFPKLQAALARAGEALDKPTLRFEGLVLKGAGHYSPWFGTVSIFWQGEYAGRIERDGRLTPKGRPDPALLSRLAEIEIDPAAAAKADGHRMGSCSCCGRLLTDPVSVEAGIGPICAERFGW
jgi:hypothetical protein